MQEFVILFHTMPTSSGRSSHWDLMLQDGQQLLTWALDRQPLPGRTITGMRLADHRIKYLQFEGQIPGGRGDVSQVAKGKFEWLSGKDSDPWQIRMFPESEIWRVECRRIDDQRSEFSFMPDGVDPSD